MNRPHFAFSPEAVLEGICHNDRSIVEAYYYYLRERAFGIFCAGRPRGSTAYLAMEDCFSLAFMTLLEKVRSGGYEHRNLDAFALGIVRNCYSDAQKKMRRHAWGELSTAAEPRDEAPAIHLSAASLFDELPEIHLLHWYFGLEQMSQRILDLRAQGYNHYEIAELLPLAPGTVRNRFSRMVREAREVVQAA